MLHFSYFHKCHLPTSMVMVSAVLVLLIRKATEETRLEEQVYSSPDRAAAVVDIVLV